MDEIQREGNAAKEHSVRVGQNPTKGRGKVDRKNEENRADERICPSEIP